MEYEISDPGMGCNVDINDVSSGGLWLAIIENNKKLFNKLCLRIKMLRMNS